MGAGATHPVIVGSVSAFISERAGCWRSKVSTISQFRPPKVMKISFLILIGCWLRTVMGLSVTLSPVPRLIVSMRAPEAGQIM